MDLLFICFAFFHSILEISLRRLSAASLARLRARPRLYSVPRHDHFHSSSVFAAATAVAGAVERGWRSAFVAARRALFAT